MLSKQDFQHSLFDRDYSGRILNGTYSPELKGKVSDAINQFLVLDRIGSAAIPYISAWHEQDSDIWYEFAGRRFKEFFGCKGSELVNVFQSSIIDRIIYKFPQIHSAIRKETLNRHALLHTRNQIRDTCMKEGTVDAVYKILTPFNSVIWLKDQATIESVHGDGICLSRGILIDVTKEMAAEEQLREAKSELIRHQDHLEEMIKERTEKLWKSQLEIVCRLARAAEFRDSKTGLHIAKMSHYCAALGKAAGLTGQASSCLFHAAPMHDVGKIGITDSILLKPGPLTSDEYERMKSHCRIGAKLLSGYDSNLLRVAKSIALHHHERWDGSGYPHGLASHDIPLAGRIAAICDVFDALTSERPYKKAWSFDQAVGELRNGKGSHFDPLLIDRFTAILPEIKQIHLQH